MSVDYARGEARLDSSSSSSSSSEDEDERSAKMNEDPDEVIVIGFHQAGAVGGFTRDWLVSLWQVQIQFDKWGELDHDCERTDDATRRLAVCNMDWDRVGAEDIFVALTSFCPPGGHVVSVSVYKSEFGKSRMEDEERLGPVELRMGSSGAADGDKEIHTGIKNESIEDADKRAMERVRQYQVNRLKYYYAVAEFDCMESAQKASLPMPSLIRFFGKRNNTIVFHGIRLSGVQ